MLDWGDRGSHAAVSQPRAPERGSSRLGIGGKPRHRGQMFSQATCAEGTGSNKTFDVLCLSLAAKMRCRNGTVFAA